MLEPIRELRSTRKPTLFGAATHMPLTDVLIRNSRPKDQTFKLPDGDGLFLLVNPHGSRGWRFRYRFHGKQKTLPFGPYPEDPLKTARVGPLSGLKARHIKC
jgi:hypothetical protein